MARYAYDVNTTQRYIDVHKQFQGGLKTVDTDDALGAVFLRDAQNISLSEFGFLEKRYGTYENFKAALSVTENSFLQGYWEFLGKYIIIALDGNIYWQLLSAPTSAFTKIDTLYKVEDLKYSENLARHLSATVETEEYIGGIDFFQKTKPMGAVNIKNVFYIFTGYYPIYLVEEDNTLKAYAFAKEDPTYAELIVTGHNLLEDDYDELYYGDVDPIQDIGILENTEDTQFVIKDSKYAPKLPFAKDGTLEFNLSYDYDVNLATDFAVDTTDFTPAILNEFVLKKVQARPSGPGATDLSYVDFDLNDIEYNGLNNVTEALAETTNILSPPITNFSSVNISSELTTPNLSVTDLTTTSVYEKYWAADVNIGGVVASSQFQLYDTTTELFRLEGKDIEVTVDNFPAENLEVGKTWAFGIYDGSSIVDFETPINTLRPQLNSYRLGDSRNKSFVTEVQKISDREFRYILFYKAVNIGVTDSYIPVFYHSETFDTFYEDIGNARIEWEFTGSTFDNIQVKLFAPDALSNPSAVPFLTDIVEYFDVGANTSRTLLYSELTAGIPMQRTERDNFNDFAYRVNTGTTVELYYHTNSDSPGIPLGTFKLGVSEDLSFEDGIYYFNITQQLVDTINALPSTPNHFSWGFKTVDVRMTQTNGQNAFLAQEPDDSEFFTENTSLDGSSTPISQRYYFYPNISNYTKVTADDFLGIHLNTFTYDIYEVLDSFDLKQLDSLGSDTLYIRIKNALLSGTYDFRFEYALEQTELNYATLRLSETVQTKTITHIVKDITITEEKLDDFTFFQGDRAHPIWSCNNVIEHFGKLMAWGSNEMPTALFYSFPDRPFYFPSFFYLDFTNEEDKPLVKVTPYMNILVAQTEDQTWGIRGNSGLIDAPSPYVEFSINSTVGTIAPKSVRPVRNHLFFLSKQGVIALKSLYAADEQYNIEFVDRNIRNIVPQDSDAVGIQFDNQYWLNFPNFGITLRWYIDKKAWVLDNYDAWNNFKGVFKYQIKDGKLEFITIPSKFLETEDLGIYKVGVDYSLPTDLGGDVLTKIETSFLNQNYPFHPKNYKEAKLDFTIQNEYNLSQNALYTLESSEDISDNIHTIDNVTVLKNHRYRIIYNFSQHTPEEDIVTATFTEEPTDLISGGDFSVNTYNLFGALSFSLLGAQDLQITEVRVTDSEGVETVLPVTVVEESDYDEYVEFVIPNSINGIVDIQVIGEFSTFDDGAVMYDVTYDNNLTINTWIMSESQTLNIDNLESYDQSKAALEVDFNGRLGTWEFGSSDFGNKVTAVKTIKLSGRGYNSKVYIEDTTKSKWTLESLGLTYKMKRARSR